MNKNKVFVSRSIYTALDFLSDVGGIQGILITFFAFCTTALNTDNFEEHLVRYLYTYRSKTKKGPLDANGPSKG